MIVTLFVTEPLALEAVMVYVVVVAGETVELPFAATAPRPVTETDVAPEVLHCSVDVWPAVMLVGVAEMDALGSPAATLTVTFCVVVPEPFVAVIVYVVVAVGATVVEPEAATAPTPGLIETPVAPVVDQLKVLVCPDVMLVGLALSEAVGFAAEVEGTWTTYTSRRPLPPQLLVKAT